MKKITRQDFIKFFKEINPHHYVCIGITVAFILMNIFCFPYTFPRLGEAFRDFGRSVAYYFTELFGFSDMIVPSVTAKSKMPFTLVSSFPSTWDEFKIKFNLYWQEFADTNNVVGYLYSLRLNLLLSAHILTFVLPLLAILVYVVIRSLKSQNLLYNEDTKPLKAFKKISDKIYRPTKRYLVSLFTFMRDYRFVFPKLKKVKPGYIPEEKSISYVEIWAFIWVLNFNLLTILIEACAYYFYLCVSYDIISLYLQVYKLLLDLSVMIKFVPVPVWILIGAIVLDKIRKKRGYENLWHNELKNRGFINARGVFSIVVAPMRGGKDKFMVDMSLSREVMYRDKALDIMRKSDLKFPYFPWINFELSLMNAILKKSVYNLATCRRFVMSKMKKYYRHPIEKYLFDYDFNRYGMEYDNAKYIETLEDVLNDYAQAFFVYMVRSSLIFSNCSIRVDSVLSSIGNFSLWSDDFFKVRSKDVNYISRFCKIMNWDFFRISKRVGEDPDFAFEFGIVNITEMGKDRPNMIESEGMKRSDEEANPKNDGFNDEVKIVGHGATIDYTCFANITGNDQREEQIPASLLGTAEILRIEQTEKGLMAMPFFFFAERIHEICEVIFEKLHAKQRFNKGNNTLMYYILHTIIAKYEAYYNRLVNIFGYERLTVSVQDGNKQNEKKNNYYYISNKKTLSKRYATDCFSDVLAQKSKQATKGIDDIPSYARERASDDELSKTNSYFYPNICAKVKGKGKVKNKKKETPKFDVDKLKRMFKN